jgi:hypothetical protein
VLDFESRWGYEFSLFYKGFRVFRPLFSNIF